MNWPEAITAVSLVFGAVYFMRMSLRYLSGDRNWYRWF